MAVFITGSCELVYMYKEYVWKIIPKETPCIENICSRCNNNRFICSDKFRINSNKKLSDVWLIYKCSYCENTWKMSILTRKNLSHIDHHLFRRFQENNIDLVWYYAFNKSIAKYNKVRLDSNVNVEIVDHQSGYLHSTESVISVLITSEYELSIPIKKILQQKLNISVNQLVRLHHEEIIVINGNTNHDLSKKIGFGCRLLIDCTRWRG